MNILFLIILVLVILVPLMAFILSTMPSSYINRYKAEVKSRLFPIQDSSVLNEHDISHLPSPVKKYLHFTGAVGKPKVHNLRAVFSGSMKAKPGGRWMKIHSQQYNFFDDPARLFYIRAKMFGIPFDGLHQYTGDHATMQIKVANLIPVVDASGDKMDQGETVTMLNDMCLMAPATLIDANIRWEEVSDRMVRAIFTNKAQTISAELQFNETGALTNFISNDRFLSSDGKEYLNYPWSTPVKDWQEINGRKIPTSGETIWQTPEGPFCYGRFDIAEIGYNMVEFR
jgi:hypothetical protein